MQQNDEKAVTQKPAAVHLNNSILVLKIHLIAHENH